MPETCNSNNKFDLTIFVVLFARWGLPSRGRKYIFVVVEYFTKWVETKVVKSISQDNVIKFILKNIYVDLEFQYKSSLIMVNNLRVRA